MLFGRGASSKLPLWGAPWFRLVIVGAVRASGGSVLAGVDVERLPWVGAAQILGELVRTLLHLALGPL